MKINNSNGIHPLHGKLESKEATPYFDAKIKVLSAYLKANKNAKLNKALDRHFNE